MGCSEDNPPEEMLTPCESERYIDDLFAEVEMTTVKFGENFDQDGVLQELMMDIYTPAGDTEVNRPAIVLAFGGAFINGVRQSMEDFAIAYAKKGYVAATFDYRLINFAGVVPDSILAIDIAAKATADIRAAIRHLKMDAATDDLYKINPDMVFSGGVSAGALIAIQAAIYDESDLADSDFVREAVENNGGVKGDTGDAENRSYDSSVRGVVNYSGAVYDLDFIDAGDPPIVSFHGDDDIVIKYNCGFAEVLFNQIIYLNGSGKIHPRMEEVGVKNDLVRVAGGGHVDIYTDEAFSAERTTFSDIMLPFLKEEICN